MNKNKRGFTLIELMVVVLLVSILSVVTAPRLTALMVKSKEGATKTNLGMLRSAIQVYGADHEGAFPIDDLSSLSAGGKYLSGIPAANIYRNYRHASNSHINTGPDISSSIDDSGGWSYVNDRNSADWGNIRVNCSHTDVTGANWSVY